MRTTIVSLLLCFFGGQINADCAIYTTVDVGLVGYTLTSVGTVKVEGFVLFGNCPEISSAEHLITSSSYDIVGRTLYTPPNDNYYTYEWNNTLTASGDAGVCYRASMDASADNLTQGAGTAAYCLPNDPGEGDFGPLDGSRYCPLILDLNGDGVHTSGLNTAVYFWTLNGMKVRSGWTDPETEEAFLLLHVDADHQVLEHELFGSRMATSSGTLFRNGFQALASYDHDGDGQITPGDPIGDACVCGSTAITTQSRSRRRPRRPLRMASWPCIFSARTTTARITGGTV